MHRAFDDYVRAVGESLSVFLGVAYWGTRVEAAANEEYGNN